MTGDDVLERSSPTAAAAAQPPLPYPEMPLRTLPSLADRAPNEASESGIELRRLTTNSSNDLRGERRDVD
jgi:hypothetical protein